MGAIYLFTGDGAGKTTNALGLALRCIGHRKKVVMIQFMKWWKNTGEYKIQELLKPYYEVYQFGRPGWLKISKKGEARFGKYKFRVRNIDELDREFALKGLKFAKEVMKKKKPDLLILDEINLACHAGLLKVKEVLDLLKKIPKKTTVVLTGRKAPKALIKSADYVNEIIARKFPKKTLAVKGIQY
ncbi:MAG: cob(I)yrinic acid a,c-diamide adenosyltransferase [Candidatus Aenigmatarchaeota archaeon]